MKDQRQEHPVTDETRQLEQATEQTLDREATAALAALELLSPGEAAMVRPAALRPLQEAAALVAEVVTPVAPSPGLKARLLARLSAFEELRPLADVRHNDGGWTSAFPGVDVRLLFRDRATGQSTVLLRMEPGAHLPSHTHSTHEQCLVLEGDIRWGALAYQAGDFVVMPKDSRHPEVFSEQGNLLLIISGHNEYEPLKQV